MPHFENNGVFSASSYAALHLKAQLRSGDIALHSAACQELSLLLRHSRHSASKNCVNALLEDCLLACDALPELSETSFTPAAASAAALCVSRAATASLSASKAARVSAQHRSACLAAARRAASAEAEEDAATAEALPFDALALIFSHLSLEALARATCVCASWRAVGEREELWQAHLARLRPSRLLAMHPPAEGESARGALQRCGSALRPALSLRRLCRVCHTLQWATAPHACPHADWREKKRETLVGVTPAAAVFHTLRSCGAEERIPRALRRELEAELRRCVGDDDSDGEGEAEESDEDGTQRRRLWAL